jgi:hypothetical protein
MITHLSQIEDILPIESTFEICTSGSNDEAVKAWNKKLKICITKTNAISLLMEYGGWSYDDLLKETLTKIKERLIWIAAWNVFENSDG